MCHLGAYMWGEGVCRLGAYRGVHVVLVRTCGGGVYVVLVRTCGGGVYVILVHTSGVRGICCDAKSHALGVCHTHFSLYLQLTRLPPQSSSISPITSNFQALALHSSLPIF